MTQTINLDEELKGKGGESRYPMVNDTPEGWPPLKATEGETWYQRALNYEREWGEPVKTLAEMELEKEDGV